MGSAVTTIDIVAQVTDKTASGANSAISNVSRMERSLKNFESRLKLMRGMSKMELKAEFKDMASKGITTIINKGKQLAGKVWTVTLRALDLVSAPFRKIMSLVSSPITQMITIAGVGMGAADVINTFKSFEQGMANVKAISGATGAEFDALSATAQRLGETTQFSASQAAEAMENLAMAGWKSQNIISGMPGLLDLAAAGSVDLATASDVVSSALAQFNMDATESSRVADVLAAVATNSKTDVAGLGQSLKMAGTQAGALGYKIEDAAIALGLMGNAGIDASSAGTALRTTLARMSKQEGMTQEETNAMAKAMSKVGVSLTDSEGRSKSLLEVMKELRQGFQGMTEVEKASTAANLAGMYAQSGLLAIVNASDEKFNQLTEAIDASRGSAERMAKTKMDTLEGSLKYLQSAAEGVKISIGKKLEPYLKGFVDWLTTKMPDIQKGLEGVIDSITGRIDKMKSRISDLMSSSEWKNAENNIERLKLAWNKLIVDPFSKWWNGKSGFGASGKEWIAGIAGNIGELMGTAIHQGINALLGLDIVGTGVNIGKSFVDGFSKGLAELGPIVQATLIAKIAMPLFTIGKGIYGIGKALIGTWTAAGATSAAGSTAATAGESAGTNAANAAATGGIIGGLSKIGTKFVGQERAANMSQGKLAAAGTAGIAGAILGINGIVSGIGDVVAGISSSDQKRQEAYLGAGVTQLAGVGGGAALGAAIGSAVPVLGTAIGAGIGAVVGGLLGDVIKDSYEKQTTLEDKGKILSNVVGAKKGTEWQLKNTALKEALMDSNVSAERFQEIFEEEKLKSLSEAFGDVKLSMDEVQAAAKKIVFAGLDSKFDTFSQAVQDADSSLATFKSTATDLQKANWKASLGLQLSETDQQAYKAAMDDFVNSAKSYIENKHYETSVAMKLLMGNDVDMTGINDMYSNFQSQVDALNTEFTTQYNIAIKDGVIKADEQAILQGIQDEITGITNQLANAQSNAELEALQIKFKGAKLDSESFLSLQSEIDKWAQSAIGNYDDALTITLTNLNMALDSGAIKQEVYDQLKNQAIENYELNIGTINARVEDVELGAIADAYANQLDGILPDIEGSIKDKLTTAMNNALSIEPDVQKWTPEQINKWFGLDSLNLDPPVLAAIQSLLTTVADSLGTGLPETVAPTVKNGIEQGAMQGAASVDYAGVAQSTSSFMEGAFAAVSFPGVGANVINAVAYSINSASRGPINTAASRMKSDAQNAINNVFSGGLKATVDVLVNYVTREQNKPSISSLGGVSSVIPFAGHAEGGIMNTPHYGLVAEDGAEAIIPLSGKYRNRGLSLWEKAGEILGVVPHADGGIFGYQPMEPLPVPTAAAVSGGINTPVTIENVNFDVNIDGSETNSPQELAEAIRSHVKGMTDEIAYQLATALQQTFANTPKTAWGG